MWLLHREIREHGHYSSPATMNQTPNGFPATTTHFPLCFMCQPPYKKAAGKNWWGGSFWREGQGRWVKARRTSAVCERVPLSILYVWNYWHTLTSYLTPPTVTVLPLHAPFHILTRLSFLPLLPFFSSVHWGQSQIYNNCQSQGWQIN